MATREERKELFNHVIRRDGKPGRVPLLCNVSSSWKVLESRYPLSDALRNGEHLKQCTLDFHEKYDYDAYCDMGGRNPLRVADALGRSGHIIDDAAGTISIKDNKYMTEDDYDIILKKGWKRWLLENYLPRRLQVRSAEEFADKLDSGVPEMLKYFEEMGQIGAAMNERNALGGGMSFVIQPACMLMNWYRGIENFSIDLRRRKEKVKAVLDIIWEETSPYAHADSTLEEQADVSTANKMIMTSKINADDPNCMAMANHQATFLSNAVMNPKQFEYFIWPYFSQALDYAVAHNQTVFLYAEADVLRFKDYINSVPKGTMAVMLEMDDLFEAKKVIGDHVALVGGYPVNYLYHKSIEENIDLCKRIMDEVAYDGTYIYSENKIVCHKTDADPEKLKAVVDFFRNTKY